MVPGTRFKHIWNTFDLIVTGYSAVAFLQHLITAYDPEHSVGLAISTVMIWIKVVDRSGFYVNIVLINQ